MPASIMSPTGSCSTGAPPAVQLLKSSRSRRGSHGTEAGIDRTIASTDMLVKTNTGSIRVRLAIFCGRWMARFIAVQPPIESPTTCTSGSGSCAITSCSHVA